jgi:c-di-GMP-binding flagellar brake protein YcgR
LSEALPAEHVVRAPQEIARVLQVLAAHDAPILSHVARGTMQFISRLRHIDPGLRYIVLDPAADEAANAALVSRLRAIFSTTMAERYFEFACSNPVRTSHEERPAIGAEFPDILTSYSRRADARSVISPPLQCLADASGDMPFDAQVVDISPGGVGLLYPADISLEPGTTLRGCVITGPRVAPSMVDLEVRYSQTAMLSDQPTQRSGCRFVQPDSAAVRQLVSSYCGGAARK